MANTKFHLSPNIQFTELDFSTTPQNAVSARTRLGVVGEFPYGPAFQLVKFTDYDTFSATMGGLNPCYYKGTQQLQYESNYVAKEFLSESNEMYACRVLGLSGSDMGDAYSITFGAALDPSTIEMVYQTGFTATVMVVDGVITSVEFDDPVLQTLYDAGEIPVSLFKNGVLSTGETLSIPNTFYGDCEAYDGARFHATVTDVDETYICITGVTISSSGYTTSTEVQNCVVVYGAGSVTYNSTFVVSVVNPIVLVNTSNSDLVFVNNGVLTLQGGTITHYEDGSLIIEDGTIVLPNGDTLVGGSYKICSLEGNDAVYLCDGGYTIDGDNILITTGTTVIEVPVVSTGATTTITQIPSGLKTITMSGDVTTLTGTPYEDLDGTLVTTLRSYGSYDSDEILNFDVHGNVVSLSSLDGGKIGALDDFRLSGIDKLGNPFSYVVSFDRSKKSYIGRVFGKNPQMCCDTNTEFWIEELYINMFEKLIDEGKIDCIKPTVCFSSSLDNYKQQYQNAVTPWVVSEVRGDKIFRLFRFHTIASGNSANEQIKVSISNIKPDTGYFDVEIRAFSDTDKRPVFLERFSRVSLNERDNNYIARAIGTLDETFDRKSNYVLLEIANDCVADSFPAGFEGYVVRDFECKAPMMTYKTTYGAFDKVKNIYLGISDTVGIEKDFFRYMGVGVEGEFTGRTHGYHLDVTATGATVLDAEGTVVFDTSSYEFKTESDLSGTPFEKIVARKFTLVPAGGWDGWDIHRTLRTNTDSYKLGGLSGTKGLTSGAFDSYAMLDGTQAINSDYYAFLEGILKFRNPEEVSINLFATPNLNTLEHSDLIDEAIEMIEDERCDAFYVINSRDHGDSFEPFTSSDYADRLDGLFDTSWAATYGYWGRLYDEENNTTVWISPVSQVCKVFAQSDKVSAPWYAAAGYNRGLTNFKTLRYKPTLDDRDNLIGGRINPILYDKGSSYVFGNRTLQINDQSSALNLVSVRRMLIELRAKIANVSKYLLFEPNDLRVRTQFTNSINPILQSLVDERGLLRFNLSVDVSNESLNSQTLKCVIELVPTRDVEAIDVKFKISKLGVEFEAQ